MQGTPAAQSISWTSNEVSIVIDNSKYTGGNTANPSLSQAMPVAMSVVPPMQPVHQQVGCLVLHTGVSMI